MFFFEHGECPSSNRRNVFPGTRGMSFFEHRECVSSNPRDVLLRTRGMSFLEHKECHSSNARNVLLRTHGMSFLEHKDRLSSNTRNFSAVLCALPLRQCNKRNTANCGRRTKCGQNMSGRRPSARVKTKMAMSVDSYKRGLEESADSKKVWTRT